jgi:hypothetical protein
MLIINHRIDERWVIKVADFGLSEALTVSVDYREVKNIITMANLKLPFKWMAPESLLAGTFSEKSDVVGKTHWALISRYTPMGCYFLMVLC